MTKAPAAVLIAFALLLAACGNKGDLRRPTAPAAAPAAASPHLCRDALRGDGRAFCRTA